MLNSSSKPGPLGMLWAATFALAITTTGCSPQAQPSEFFGKVKPPQGQVLRYISGGEPESLDPQIGSGQPEARIYMALFEGLVEDSQGGPRPAETESALV